MRCGVGSGCQHPEELRSAALASVEGWYTLRGIIRGRRRIERDVYRLKRCTRRACVRRCACGKRKRMDPWSATSKIQHKREPRRSIESMPKNVTKKSRTISTRGGARCGERLRRHSKTKRAARSPLSISLSLATPRHATAPRCLASLAVWRARTFTHHSVTRRCPRTHTRRTRRISSGPRRRAGCYGVLARPAPHPPHNGTRARVVGLSGARLRRRVPPRCIRPLTPPSSWERATSARGTPRCTARPSGRPTSRTRA